MSTIRFHRLHLPHALGFILAAAALAVVFVVVESGLVWLAAGIALLAGVRTEGGRYGAMYWRATAAGAMLGVALLIWLT